MLLGFYSEQMHLISYQDNDQWEVLRPVVFIEKRSKMNIAEYGSVSLYEDFADLIIKRRSLFSILFLIFPTDLLYVLSSFTFFLPVDSGEKVSYAVTLLLAQIVSFGTLGNLFPPSSKNVPKLVYFVVAVTVHMSISCLLAIFGNSLQFI